VRALPARAKHTQNAGGKRPVGGFYEESDAFSIPHCALLARTHTPSDLHFPAHVLYSQPRQTPPRLPPRRRRTTTAVKSAPPLAPARPSRNCQTFKKKKWLPRQKANKIAGRCPPRVDCGVACRRYEVRLPTVLCSTPYGCARRCSVLRFAPCVHEARWRRKRRKKTSPFFASCFRAVMGSKQGLLLVGTVFLM
jgi:hypothetical protein